ncbi:MAG TPA: DRTGG domain-containing protein [Dehalococcoidales bacterium]|nr:DRTGG domain-containing protein [Dehalococcoidales bacterium]
MKKIIVGSVREDAGKTSFIIGLAKTAHKKFAYLKPFGDKLIYRKKRLWDYDAALMTNIFGLQQSSEEMTIGFEHAKLLYMYDEAGTKAKLDEMMKNLEGAGDLLIIEGGKSMRWGASVRLDTLTVAKYTGAKLILLVSGDEAGINDDMVFQKKYMNLSGIDYSIVINKVKNIEDYRSTHLPDIKNLGIDVLGVIPEMPELTYFSMEYLAEMLQARVLGGEEGLKNRVKKIYVGSMSGDAAMVNPIYKEKDKLIIVSGDRSDHLVAAIHSSTAGIILTNNIIPPQNLVSRATDKNIPLLLVPFTTFETAKKVDDAAPLLTKDDTEQIQSLQKLIEQNVDYKRIL